MTKFLNISTDTTLGGNAPSDELAVSQKAIKTYVDNHSGGGSVAIDNTTITKNASDEIQAVAVIDQNTGIAKTWTGTQAEYDAIVTKDPETEYIITDDIGGSATEIGQITEDVNELKAHEVIAFQAPTADNNYTWYRKYADGWAEQGGIVATPNADTTYSVSMPIEMSDTNYLPQITTTTGNSNAVISSVYTGNAITTTGFSFRLSHKYNSAGTPTKTVWQVSGMAA